MKEKKDSTYQEFHALRLVNMATDVLIGYLLCMDALKSDRKKRVAEIYVSKARYRVQESMGFILSDETGIIDFHHEIISDG